MENRHTILVAGWSYRQDVLASLMTEKNDAYSWSKKDILDEFDLTDRIYQYEIAYYPLHIEAEPDNPYDPQAVMVYAGDDFVGYLPRGGFPELKSYAMIEGVNCYVQIKGGKYKHFEHDDDADYLDTWEDKYMRLVTDSTEYKAVIVFEW